MLPKQLSWALAAFLVVFAAGCNALHKQQKKSQLQQVARDWCMTITASQVMPVYPLTEDVQPGDVFLVPMSVEEQRQRFDDKGFLPLDHHVARLTPDGYARFYRDMFVVPKGSTTTDFTRSFQRGTNGKPNWQSAPAAAFPTYGFSVSRSGGFNAGIPLSGVPIGMSLLGATEANGSVTIKDAHTIGLDVLPLSDELEEWAAEHADYLRPYALDLDQQDKTATMRSYLRIVTRVYVTGGVDISVSNAESSAAGIDAGKPRPVDLLTAAAPDSLDDVDASRIENHRRAIAALNAGMAESLAPTRPSGSNDDATVEQTDARAKAKQQALEEARAKRKEELKAATDKVSAEAEKEEVKKALDAIKEADADVKARRSDWLKTRHDPNATKDDVAKAKAALDQSKADARAAAASDELKALAGLKGKADVAQMAFDKVTDVIPGASIRVTSASSRFVTLRQDFDPPLVIGYLGFDRQILLKDNRVFLGAPVATQQQILDKNAPIPAEGTKISVSASNNEHQAVALRKAIRDWYRQDPPNVKADKLARMNEFRKTRFPQSDQATVFPNWMQSADAAELEVVRKQFQIPIP